MNHPQFTSSRGGASFLPSSSLEGGGGVGSGVVSVGGGLGIIGSRQCGVPPHQALSSQANFGSSSMSSEEELSSAAAIPMSTDTLLEGGASSFNPSSSSSSCTTGINSGTSSSLAHNLRSNSSSSSQLLCSSSTSSGTGVGVKVKRTRQRVDAGEPRNSYASIANFSSTRSGYQLIRSGRNPVGPLFGPSGHLNQSYTNSHNSNSNEGIFNSHHSFNGNSPPNFKLLQQLSGNISPKSPSSQGINNNDSNNNFGQFKSSHNSFNLQDKDRSMILLDEAVMQIAAHAAAMNNPGLNGNSVVRGMNQVSNQSDDDLSNDASHLLRDILQTKAGISRSNQQATALEQVMAGLASKDGQGAIGGILGGGSSRNQSSSHNSQCSDDDEERDENEGEENENNGNNEDVEMLESSTLQEDEPRSRRKTRSTSRQPATDAGDVLADGPGSSIKRKLRSSSKNNSSSVRSSSQISSGSRCSSPSSELGPEPNNGEGEEVVEAAEKNDGEEDSSNTINGKSNSKVGDNNNSTTISVDGSSQDLTAEIEAGISKVEESESERLSPAKEDSTKLGSKLEKLVSNMSQVSSNNNTANGTAVNQANENGSNGKLAPVAVNGCKKRKLYQPVQSSKLTTEEDDEDELLLSNDEEDFDDCMDEDNLSSTSTKFWPSSPKRPKQQLKSQYLELLKSHMAMNRGNHSGSEDERDAATSSPLSDRSRGSSSPLSFNEIKQQALNTVTAAILNQRCGSTMNGNGEQWVTALKSELVENVAKAIEITFAEFNRRNPMIKGAHAHREGVFQVTHQLSQGAPKDISLLTQMLESKSTPASHHGHHGHHHQPRARGATLLGKAPSVRDDRSSKNPRGRPPMNGHPSNVNPFDRDGHVKNPFSSPFPGFSSPMSGSFKNPFPFFPPGGPNPATGLPPMPPSLAEHFTSIANALHRQRQEALNAQSSVANLSRAMEQSSQRAGPEGRENESPSNRSTNNLSTGNVDTQSEALSLVVSPKRKVGRPSKVSWMMFLSQDSFLQLLLYQESLLNMYGRESSPPPFGAGTNTPSAPPPPLVPVSLQTSVAVPNPSLHGNTEGPFGAGPAFPFGSNPSRFSGLFASHRVQSPEEARGQAEILGHLRDKPGLAQVMSNAALACKPIFEICRSDNN